MANQFTPRQVQSKSLHYEIGFRLDSLIADGEDRVTVVHLIPDMTKIFPEIERFRGEKDRRDSIRFPSRVLRDDFLLRARQINHDNLLDPARWPIAFYGASPALRCDIERYLQESTPKRHLSGCGEFLRKASADRNHRMYGARIGLLPTVARLYDATPRGQRVPYPWPRIHQNKIGDVLQLCNTEAVNLRLSRANDRLDSLGFFTVNSADAALDLVRAAHRSLYVSQAVCGLKDYEVVRFSGISNQTMFEEVTFEVLFG